MPDDTAKWGRKEDKKMLLTDSRRPSAGSRRIPRSSRPMESLGLRRLRQIDSVRSEEGMNFYGYVANDPVNAIDPDGLAGIPSKGCEKDPHVDATICGWGAVAKLQQQALAQRPPLPGSAQIAKLQEAALRAKMRQQQRGCSAAKAAQLAQVNGIASNLGPVAFDSANERSLLAQYFRGDTTPYRLNGAEMAQARAYVITYGNSVLGSTIRAGANGTTERSVFFGKFASDASLLDGLLGTATGIFRGGSLIGIRDTFNFDFKDRGGYPYGTFANAGVAMIRADAATCAGNVSIPVSGG